MKKIIWALIFISAFYQSQGQVKKYKGIITALMTNYVGYVYLNLSGENKGLIKIDGKSIGDSSTLSKLLSIPDKEFTTFKLNAAFISKVVIGTDTFYRQDLLDTYEKDGNKKENCFVKKIFGKNDVQLYEWKDSRNQLQYYFKLPQEDVLKNLNHPYFLEWNMSIYYAFKKCKIITQRFLSFYEDKTKYPFYQMDIDAKLNAWKKLIDEYDGCDLVMKK